MTLMLGRQDPDGTPEATARPAATIDAHNLDTVEIAILRHQVAVFCWGTASAIHPGGSDAVGRSGEAAAAVVGVPGHAGDVAAPAPGVGGSAVDVLAGWS
jgi:hypothetical protein